MDKLSMNYLLIVIGSLNAGFAAYVITGDTAVGFLVFGAAFGLFGSID